MWLLGWYSSSAAWLTMSIHVRPQAIIFDTKSMQLNEDEDAFKIFQPYIDATDKVTASSPESH